MRKRYVYNQDMKTLIYVHPNGTMGKDNESATCTHTLDEAVKFTSTYVTYDGVEEYVTKGRACVACGLLLTGTPTEDVAAVLVETKLIDLLGK